MKSVGEKAIEKFLLVCAGLSVMTTLAIIAVLLEGTVAFFSEVSVVRFLTDPRWTPLLRPRQYGIWPLISGTVLITVGSALVSIPLGLGTALYLSEFATPRTRERLKPTLEILAGIPTVVYGYFALTAITPLLRTFVFGPEAMHTFNALSASLVVGIMTLPMVASLCDDALRAVPGSLRETGFALGATPLEVAIKVVLPAALSGVMAAFVLAISRAIGETMAVTLAAGQTPQITVNPLESVQTLTAYIVQVATGDAPFGSTAYKTLFAVGFVLFFMTLVMNLLAQLLIHRYQEQVR